MKLLAPAYYARFRCIADCCRHSCCIDWEICIDDDTLEKYRPISSIMDTVTLSEGEASFCLRADGRCPHLADDGLCRLILSHGEDYLSDICRLHPRFLNDMGGGCMEVGLGLVCEEACRLILADDAPFRLVAIDSPAGCPEPSSEPLDFDPRPTRDAILAEIGRPGVPLDDLLVALRAAYELPPLHSPDEWIDRFLSLEILDPAWAGTLRAAQSRAARSQTTEDTAALDPALTRLLAYFVYRHVSAAGDPDDLRARLGFAILSVEMIRRLLAAVEEQTPAALADLARRYSAEIEYSEDNTDELIFAFACAL